MQHLSLLLQLNLIALSKKQSQGDIIFLSNENELPDGTKKKHPILIINSNKSISHEGVDKCFYIGVMLTTSSQKDRYSLPIRNEQLLRPADKAGMQIRKHIIFSFNEKEIYSFSNQIHKEPLKHIIKEIFEDVFEID